jgi:hypothetical protein
MSRNFSPRRRNRAGPSPGLHSRLAGFASPNRRELRNRLLQQLQPFTRHTIAPAIDIRSHFPQVWQDYSQSRAHRISHPIPTMGTVLVALGTAPT